MFYKQVVATKDETTPQLTFSDGTKTHKIVKGDKLELIEYRRTSKGASWNGEEIAVVRDWTRASPLAGVENYGGFREIPKSHVEEIDELGYR